MEEEEGEGEKMVEDWAVARAARAARTASELRGCIMRRFCEKRTVGGLGGAIISAMVSCFST